MCYAGIGCAKKVRSGSPLFRDASLEIDRILRKQENSHEADGQKTAKIVAFEMGNCGMVKTGTGKERLC